ncbi:MAG: recombinase family protein [Clostridiales bacterium]|nr:recombinase family protein [Clostridiales bacterium]
MGKRVIQIPATVSRFTEAPINERRKRKTAGYARVSTDRDEQATSYEAQMSYYKDYIESRDDLEFVGMYSDEGISATSTARRDGFNRMIEDALAGKIELIITKSVSRFARNTVDSLTTIRKLKEKGVECYFEKENIWTLDSKGELLITIMSSLAQEESRSISENTTWGQRKRFADGVASVAYSSFLGYDRAPGGGFAVNPEQAETVKQIYKWFLEGLSTYEIAKLLTEKKIPTPMGKEKWYPKTVGSILQNEKYKGDALLQKYYVADFLSKKLKKNNGEIPQYYVEGDHEAIIDPVTFDLVQAEILRRDKSSSKYSGISIYSSKIKCGECGNWYGSKVWHSNDKYRKVIYQCNHKFKGDKKCSTPHLTEVEIQEKFMQAVNLLIGEKDELIENAKLMMQTVCDTSSQEKEAEELAAEMEVLAGMVQDAISENARVAKDQNEYGLRYNELTSRYDKKKTKYEELLATIADRDAQAKLFKNYIATLESIDGFCTEFDARLWAGLLEYATVYTKDDIRFTFRGGTTIKV